MLNHVTSSLALHRGNFYKNDNQEQLSSWLCIIIHIQRVKSCQACQKISSCLDLKLNPNPGRHLQTFFCWRLFWVFMSKYTLHTTLKNWHTFSYYFSFRFLFDDGLMITILYGCILCRDACINNAVTVCFCIFISVPIEHVAKWKMKLPKPCGIVLIISHSLTIIKPCHACFSP